MEIQNSNPQENFIFNVKCRDVLSGMSRNYHIETFLGQGGFGKVAKCRISKTKEYVAVKVLTKNNLEEGRLEAQTMEKIRKLDPEKNNMVIMTEHFIHEQHFCLVYELLDVSLFDFMEARNFQPLELSAIRVVGQQILVALRAMRSIHLVHGDIKPENIMLVKHLSQPFKVKLIDFGLATAASDLWIQGVLQNLPYRPPEVLLHLPTLDEAVDMWSFAGVLAFLYLGDDLYPNECEYEAMRMICELNGEPSNDFLDAAFDSDSFFDLVQEVPEPMWYLKSPEQYTQETQEKIVEHCSDSCKFGSLDDLMLKQPRKKDPIVHQDTLAFISLLKRMLAVNPQDRITPSEALNCDFLSLKHFPVACDDSYVLSAKRMMMVCYNEGETSVPVEFREKNGSFLGSCDSNLKLTTVSHWSNETTNVKIDRIPINSKEENIKAPDMFKKLRHKTFVAGNCKEEVKPVQRSVTKSVKNRTCDATTIKKAVKLLPRAGAKKQRGTSKIFLFNNRKCNGNSTKEEISPPITGAKSQQSISKITVFRNTECVEDFTEEKILSVPVTGTEDRQEDSAIQLTENISGAELKPVNKFFKRIHKFFPRLFKPLHKHHKSNDDK